MNTKCRACGAEVEAFMSFGQQPIANRFIDPAHDADEYFFDMSVGICAQCSLFQLIEQPSPEEMFHDNYAFFSQTSQGMQRHFESFAQSIKQKFLTAPNPFVVEIGCNDGIMLRHFAEDEISHLGFEPSLNVATKAREIGVNAVHKFFGQDTAAEVAAEYGRADVILAANVMCHIPDLSSVGHGVDRLLKPEGVLVFEEPYLGDVIEKTSYDQIYDEHVFLFSATSVSKAFAPYNLILIDAEHQTTHGGSMRYTLGRPSHHKQSTKVVELIQREREIGLASNATMAKFKENCEKSRSELVSLLGNLKEQGKSVVGYAATSKSTTVLNYCDIGPDLISCIHDTTLLKQGTLSPGKHIPVRAFNSFHANYPDYAVLFAWNHSNEIKEKEAAFVDGGGRWIVFVPKVGIQS